MEISRGDGLGGGACSSSVAIATPAPSVCPCCSFLSSSSSFSFSSSSSSFSFSSFSSAFAVSSVSSPCPPPSSLSSSPSFPMSPFISSAPASSLSSSSSPCTLSLPPVGSLSIVTGLATSAGEHMTCNGAKVVHNHCMNK